MTQLHTDEYVSTAIGGMSLIGVGGKPPHSWGNYFSLWDGPRVLNFWAENLTAADEQFNLGGKVKIRRYRDENRDVCIIDDPRIPKEWYYNKLCFTGSGGGVSFEIAKDIYEYLGDPDNELERFTDPVSYYKKRGGTYHPGTGIVSYEVKATARKLNCEWTLDNESE